MVDPAHSSDPLLSAHRLDHGEYSIAGKYNAASIRDQMVRAVAIADRALFHGVIGPDNRLLVVGAGASGVSAALRAADRGVHTTLVERGNAPFSRQANSSRIVDPTEYDWPHPGWQEGEIPDLPLPLRRKPANELVALWLWEYRKPRGLLFSRPETEFIRSFRDGGGMTALLRGELDRQDGGYWERFDMVLNCSGPGEESVTIAEDHPDRAHASYRFWDDDPLEVDGFGLPPGRSSTPSVLISGGGDGALQDFLRIAFPKQTPSDLYLRIPEPVRTEVERRIYAAEDSFRRAWVWSENAELDCQILRQLHHEHVAVAKMVAGQGRFLPEFNEARMGKVTVIHKCDHFSVCYPFNHFLACLANEYMGGARFRAQHGLIEVVSSDAAEHQCQGKAAECWEHPHRVEFAKSHCGDPNPAKLPGSEVYDLVILRHGPKAGTPKLARQMLPYRLPWKIGK
jgi:hypothetical protein